MVVVMVVTVLAVTNISDGDGSILDGGDGRQ